MSSVIQSPPSFVFNFFTHSPGGELHEEKNEKKRRKERAFEPDCDKRESHLTLSHHNLFKGKDGLDDIVSFSDSELNRYKLTKWLTPAQRTEISKYQITRRQVELLALQLQSKGGIEKIAQKLKTNKSYYRIYPPLVLAARIKNYLGLISDAQVATACNLSNAIEQLIKNPQVLTHHMHTCTHNPTASILHTTCNSAPIASQLTSLKIYSLFDSNPQQRKEGEFLLSKFFHLNAQQMINFKEHLANPAKAESEEYFHTINLPLGSVHQWSTLYQLITDSFRVFGPVEDPSVASKSFLARLPSKVYVVPSFTMFQAFFDTYFGKNSMSLIPVIGTCTPYTIEYFKIRDQIAINLGFPGAELPLNVGQIYAGPSVKGLHSQYLALRYCLVNKQERLALVRINRLFTCVIEEIQDESLKDKFKKLKWDLIEGELHDSRKECFGAIFKIKTLPWFVEAKKLVVSDMFYFNSLWSREFNLKREDLLCVEQAMYDTCATEGVNLPNSLLKEQHPDDLIDLGNRYYEGTYLGQSYEKARQYYRLAANAGSGKGYFLLAYCCKNGKGGAKDLVEAFRLFEWAAHHSYGRAYNELGVCYEKGLGVKQDREQAFFYYDKTAHEANIAEGFLNVGMCYYQGIGVEVNFAEAFRYFQLAAEKGVHIAYYYMGLLCEEGIKGERNFTHAFTYYQKAVNHKVLQAYAKLGSYYENGLGTARNLPQAYQNYAKGAKRDDGFAQYRLAFFYEKGIIVSKSNRNALKWYKTAITNGNTSAEECLSKLQSKILKSKKKQKELSSSSIVFQGKKKRKKPSLSLITT